MCIPLCVSLFVCRKTEMSQLHSVMFRDKPTTKCVDGDWWLGNGHQQTGVCLSLKGQYTPNKNAVIIDSPSFCSKQKFFPQNTNEHLKINRWPCLKMHHESSHTTIRSCTVMGLLCQCTIKQNASKDFLGASETFFIYIKLSFNLDSTYILYFYNNCFFQHL